MAQSTTNSSADLDPYAALGVPKTATQAEIKKAYRKLVRTSHPDINPDDAGAEARFVQISNAYDLLKDPETRARFDAGEIDATGQEKPQRRYYRDYAEQQRAHPQDGGFEGMDPDDIFAQMFRQHGARQTHGFSARGQDIGYTLEVPFLDAARGGSAHITLPGEGMIDLKIPEGLRDGQTLRLRGKGGEGFGGGPRGDAQVKIRVRPHPLFRREDDDIHLVLPISLSEAVLGAKVTVPTIHGDVALTIPKGASSGKMLRLRGRGVKRKGKAGDQLVELRVMLPETVDDTLAACIEQWAKTHDEDPRADMLKGSAEMTQLFSETEVIAQVSRLTQIRLHAYIEAEAVHPTRSERGLLFETRDLARLDLLCELEEAYDMGAEALAVLITVLDQLHAARADRQALLDAISDEPPEVRARIAAALTQGAK